MCGPQLHGECFLSDDVAKAKPWVKVGIKGRTEKFVNNFLALLCIQHATNFCVLIDGATSIANLEGTTRGHMALRMALEFEKRFSNLLPNTKRRYSISVAQIRQCTMKSFIDNMKGAVMHKSVFSVNYCYHKSTNPKNWDKHIGSAMPFALAYFLRQTLTKFDERLNEYEDNFYLTEEEKRMLRQQPIYCANGTAPDDDDE